MFEGGGKLESRLRFQRRQRLFKKPAQAAFPVLAVEHGIAQGEVKGRRIIPDRDPCFGSRNRRLAHFGHRPPGIVGDVFKRRQRLSGHRPAQAVIAPRVESADRHPAAAR